MTKFAPFTFQRKCMVVLHLSLGFTVERESRTSLWSRLIKYHPKFLAHLIITLGGKTLSELAAISCNSTDGMWTYGCDHSMCIYWSTWEEYQISSEIGGAYLGRDSDFKERESYLKRMLYGRRLQLMRKKKVKWQSMNVFWMDMYILRCLSWKDHMVCKYNTILLPILWCYIITYEILINCSWNLKYNYNYRYGVAYKRSRQEFQFEHRIWCLPWSVYPQGTDDSCILPALSSLQKC